MSSTSGFILYLALPIALQSLLLFLLIQKQVSRRYPWFVIYTAFSVIATIARLITRENFGPYFYIYWGGEMIYAVLALMALFEVFRTMFRNYLRLWWFRPLFPLAVVVTIALAVLHTAAHRNPAQDQPITVAALAITFGVRLVQGACFVCLWVLVGLTGARWRQPALGIVTGFGLYASYVLVASLLRSEIGIKLDGLIVFGIPVAYIFTLALWLWFFASPQFQEPERDGVPPMSREDLALHAAAVRRIRKL
jgi:hypothetical protein